MEEVEKRDRERQRVGEGAAEEAVGNRMSLEEGAGLDGGPRGRVMSVEVRELIEGGLVWEGTSGVAEWGMCGSRVEEGSGAAMGEVPRLVIWAIDNPIQSPCHEKFKFPVQLHS
jgi:hypothetical protein